MYYLTNGKPTPPRKYVNNKGQTVERAKYNPYVGFSKDEDGKTLFRGNGWNRHMLRGLAKLRAYQIRKGAEAARRGLLKQLKACLTVAEAHRLLYGRKLKTRRGPSQERLMLVKALRSSCTMQP